MLAGAALLGAAPRAAPGVVQGDTTITIDARDGQPGAPVFRFARRERVRLEIVNVNPFIHRYRLVGTTTTYEEHALAQFAQLALGLTFTPPPAPRVSLLAVAGQADPGRRSNVAECSPPSDAADARHAGLEERTRRIDSVGKTVAAALRNLAPFARVAASLTDSLKRQTVDPALAADAIVRAVRGAFDGLTGGISTVGPGLDTVRVLHNQFTALIVDFRAVIQEAQTAFPTCQYFAIRAADAIGWVADTIRFGAVAGRLEAFVNAASQDTARLRSVLTNPALFRIVGVWGDVDRASVEDVSVQRTGLGADTVWGTIARPRFRFGEPGRFGIGLGFLWSPLATVRYTTLTRYATPSDNAGTDSVIRVIVASDSSRLQLAPMVVLTARGAAWKARFFDGAVLTIGAGTQTQGELLLAYYAGVGLTFLDGRGSLTGGVAWVKRRELADGLVVGKRLPPAQAEVVTRLTSTTQIGLMLGFKVY